ncbi:unnamed protein product, partial [Rotaria sordida]
GSDLLKYAQEDVQIVADKGFICEQYIITLQKKSRGGELTTEDKDFNRTICSARVAIENINQHIKQYAIFGHIYRGSYDDVRKSTKIGHVVCALCKLNLDRRPIRSYRT